jgi:hypothetical protein
VGTAARNITKGKLDAVFGIGNFHYVLVHMFLRTQDNIFSMLMCEQEVKSASVLILQLMM